jgi:uncharacterized protein with PQ loop repeat
MVFAIPVPIILSTLVKKAVSVLAPLLSSVIYVHQLLKTIKRKSLKDLSFYSLSILLLAEILWLIHGWFIDDFALVVSGLVQVFCVSCLVGMYWLYF